MGIVYSRVFVTPMLSLYHAARVAGFGLILPQNLQVENARMEDWIPAVTPVTLVRKIEQIVILVMATFRFQSSNDWYPREPMFPLFFAVITYFFLGFKTLSHFLFHQGAEHPQDAVAALPV